MPQQITTIRLGGLFGLGVNCYLVKTGSGFILIDTGHSPRRAALDRQLEKAGVQPGNLQLIIITHGHADHTGNCAYLCKKYAARSAMQRGDLKFMEGEDASAPLFGRILMRVIAFIAGVGEVEKFTPDLFLEEGDNLREYGFDASILHIPGHSKGSIGILTASGDLFCGDVFMNTGKPVKHSIADDPIKFKATIERLKSLDSKTVYPGHGKPFTMDRLVKKY